MKKAIKLLPEVVEFNDIVIEMFSNSMITIHNCKDVKDFDENEFTISGRDKTVRIMGTNLLLNELTIGSAIISGKIMLVEITEDV